MRRIEDALVRLWKAFRIDAAITVGALVVAFLYGGERAAAVAAILILVEIVFSFDNAAVNAKYLTKLSAFWQRMFLTVGVLIAVFGMRLIFPFVVVCLTGGVSPSEAIQLALAQGDPSVPGTYGYVLMAAHPAIAAFGGTFLLMIFLDFLFDAERDSWWLSWIERPLTRVGHLDTLTVLLAIIALLISAGLLADSQHSQVVLTSGMWGLATYIAVSGLASVMEEREAKKLTELDAQSATGRGPVGGLVGRAAFSLFIFLEVLDASFSFDGVIGAFAITPDPLIIAIGLGVGAMYVRSMTVYLVRQGTLAEYRYLEHGAHWAIGALAVMLMLTLRWHIPDVAIGLIGITFIGAAWFSSVRANRTDAAAGDDVGFDGERLLAVAPDTRDV